MCQDGVENKCIPYNDSCWITAQSLSGVACALTTYGAYVFSAAVLFSTASGAAYSGNPDDFDLQSLFGLIYTMLAAELLMIVAFIMSMVGCCCAMSKCGATSVGVLALLSGLIVITLNIIAMARISTYKTDCEEYYTSSSYSNFTLYTQSEAEDLCDEVSTLTGALMAVSIAGGVFGLITGILALVFTCTGRFETSVQKLREYNQQNGQQQPSAAHATLEATPSTKYATPVAATTY